MQNNKLFKLKSGADLLIIISIVIGLVNCKSVPTEKPNIILIMADDLGYGDLSCYGNETINTPVLDLMASEGMRFTSYYSNGAVCTPTRAALMTGNYQQRAGLEGVIFPGLHLRHGKGLSGEELTIGEIFKNKENIELKVLKKIIKRESLVKAKI